MVKLFDQPDRKRIVFVYDFLQEGSNDDPQMAAEPTYAKEIRPKKSMAQIGILSQLAELNYPKLGK